MSEKKSNLRVAVSVILACVSVLAMVVVLVAWYFTYQLLHSAEDPQGLQMTVTGIGPRFVFKEVPEEVKQDILAYYDSIEHIMPEGPRICEYRTDVAYAFIAIKNGEKEYGYYCQTEREQRNVGAGQWAAKSVGTLITIPLE